MKQYNIAKNNVEDYTSFDESVTAKFVGQGKVYITKSHKIGDKTYTDIEISTISTKSGFAEFYSYESGELDIADDGSAVVLVNENVISLIRGKNDVVKIADNNATTIKIIGYTNGCIVYYETTDSKSNIKMVSYYNYLNGGDTTISTLTTVASFEEDYAYFDVDDGYMYFYKKEGENYYLNRLKINNNLGETEEMIGEYLDADEPVVEDDDDDDEDDD